MPLSVLKNSDSLKKERKNERKKKRKKERKKGRGKKDRLILVAARVVVNNLGRLLLGEICLRPRGSLEESSEIPSLPSPLPPPPSSLDSPSFSKYSPRLRAMEETRIISKSNNTRIDPRPASLGVTRRRVQRSKASRRDKGEMDGPRARRAKLSNDSLRVCCPRGCSPHPDHQLSFSRAGRVFRKLIPRLTELG